MVGKDSGLVESALAPSPDTADGTGLDRRRRMLAEAALELNARGAGQVSLGDVANRLGVTRTALYNYVEDQKDLVFQCYRQSCEVMAKTLTRVRQRHGDALDCIDAFVDAMAQPDNAPIAAIADLAFLDDDRRDTISGLLSGVVLELAHIIETGMKAGAVRPCAPILVARAILAFVSWPPLLPPTNPELVERAQPHLAATTKSLLRLGMATDRRRLIRLEPSGDPAAAGLPTNVFERSDLARAKKEALLAKGSRLLNTKGVELTSLDEIAASVGVSKAVIYHNIGDKPTFVLECYRRSYRIALEIAGRMDRSTSDRATAIPTALYEIAYAHLQEDAPLLFPVVGFATLSETIVSETRNTNLSLQAIYHEAVRAGFAEGVVRRLDVPSLLSLMPATIQWLDKWQSIPPGPAADDDETAREIAQLVAVGLSPLEGGHSRVAAIA
jgi:AcrR family transcriptional regulator